MDNRVLRNVLEGERKEEVGEWTELHSGKLNDLHSSSKHIRVIKSRRMRWARHMARNGAKRNACRIFVGNHERKRAIGRTSCRWEYNIKIYLQDTGWQCVGWIHMTQDNDTWRAVVNTLMNIRFP